MERYEIEHIERVRKITPECMVLLKSDGSFPLDAPGKIAIYGNAARKTIKGGTGSGDVNVRHYVGIEEGLENAGFTITSKACGLTAMMRSGPRQTRNSKQASRLRLRRKA